MEKPKRKDYFEYRGKQIIIDYGHADNFMDAQDDYIEYLEAEIKKLKAELNEGQDSKLLF